MRGRDPPFPQRCQRERGPAAVPLIRLPHKQSLVDRAGDQAARARLVDGQGGREFGNRGRAVFLDRVQHAEDGRVDRHVPGQRPPALPPPDRDHRPLDRPSTMAEIDEAAKPFLNAETPTFQPIVDNLTARGWVHGEYELTDEGRQAYDEISAKVHAFRAKAIDGLTNEEYVALVTLLERVATNVAAARYACC